MRNVRGGVVNKKPNRPQVQFPGSFKFVDLFAGIGGFHLAMHALGGECVLASEIDPACRRVYSANFNLEPEGDIRELMKTPAKVPAHDVLCAGFPCQPFSKSGLQLGVRDKTRGTLFHEIMEVIALRHPRFVILENVRNLAGPRHRETWRTIVESLRDEGYQLSDEPAILSPHLLPPQSGGSPQVRERVFVLATHVGRGRSQLLSGGPLLGNKPHGEWRPSMWSVQDFLDPDEVVPDLERYRLRPDEITWLDAWQDFIQVVDELPGFPIWETALRETAELRSDMPDWELGFRRKNSGFYIRNGAKIDAWRRRHDLNRFPPSRRKFEWQARDSERNLWNLVIHFRPSGIRVKPPTYLPALVAITQTSVIGSRRRRITPREAARLQGFPESFELPNRDSVAYRQLGNAVHVGVAKFAAEALFGAFAAEAATDLGLSLAS